MAHNLLSGHAVYWLGEKWGVQFEEALIIREAQELEAIEEVTIQEKSKNQICDTEFIEIVIDELGQHKPRHFRDFIQVYGPTVSAVGNS